MILLISVILRAHVFYFSQGFFVGGVKFPQGEGSAVIHRKKNRPALQRHDIKAFLFFLFIGNLLRSSSTQFLMVLFF